MKRTLWMHPLTQLLVARLLEFIRQPEAIFWVYVFPLVMVVALGLAFRSQPVEASQVDVQAGPAAQWVARALEAEERFRVRVVSEEDARRRLRVGKTELVVVAEGREPAEGTYRYLYDPTRPGSVLARNAADDALQRAAGREDVLDTADVALSEPGGRYIDFLVPGLIGLGLMGGGLWGVGYAVVEMRIRRLLKRFLGTPMKKSHFLAAMLLSRLVFVVPEVVLLVVFSRVFFGVASRGSWGLVAVLVVLGAFEFSAIGLLVASRARTLESVSGLMNLVMVPMWIASGIFFSADRFPALFQPAIDLLPLTPLIAALRAVMLEGAGVAGIATELVLVALWGAGSFAVALKSFRWE